jgi:hypothetical protein
VPEEELLGFFNRLKMNLIEGKKNGDKKEFEFEIRGTEEDLKGISLEIINFDKSKYKEYFDSSEEYMKRSLMIFSLKLKIREGKDEEKSKKFIQEFFDNTLNKKYPQHFELHYRHKDQKLIIDLILVKGEVIKPLIDLGVDLNKFTDFNLIFKSKIDFNEILDDKIEERKKFIDLLSLLFSIKSSGENIKYLIRAFYEALKDVKLNEFKLQKKYNEIIKFLNFIHCLITSKIKLNFKAKDMINSGLEKFFSPSFIKILVQIIKPIFEYYNYNSIDFEELSLNFSIPKYQNGLSILLKFPGFSNLFS